MPVADQLQYEYRVRMRYAVIAFCAALLIVGSQLINLSGVHAPVNELTLDMGERGRQAVAELLARAGAGREPEFVEQPVG